MIYYNEKGIYADFDKKTREVTHYHVVFLDPKCSTVSRVRANRVRKFQSLTDIDLQSVVSVGSPYTMIVFFL